MMVLLAIEKNDMFRPIAAIFRFHNFLAKRVLYNMPKLRGDVEILTKARKMMISSQHHHAV